MPCVRKKRYDKLKKSQLKALLLQRDESTSRSQSTLVACTTKSNNPQAVSQDDELDFMKFPGEVRNEIYKLVADHVIEKTDSRACLAIYSSDEWDWKKDKRLTLRGNPQLMILQPGLFLASRQIRTEGLPFFYQRREFDLILDHGKRVLDIYWDQTGFSYWFQAIGDVGQKNIRHLTLRNAPMVKGVKFVERVHRKLSEEATVLYKADTYAFARGLWKIGAKYKAKNEKKVPTFWSGYAPEFSDYDQVPGDYNLGRHCKLEFEAGSGWFGMAQNDKAQLWWRRDKRIEKWNEEWLAKDEGSRLEMEEKRRIGRIRRSLVKRVILSDWPEPMFEDTDVEWNSQMDEDESV